MVAAKKLLNKNIVSGSDNAIKASWKVVRDELGTRVKFDVCPVLKLDERLVSDLTEVATLLNQYFLNVAKEFCKGSSIEALSLAMRNNINVQDYFFFRQWS